jgi:hypothetical protein
MTADIDINRAPRLLIDRHGEDAGSRAARRANELQEDGESVN